MTKAQPETACEKHLVKQEGIRCGFGEISRIENACSVVCNGLVEQAFYLSQEDSGISYQE